MTKLIGLNTNIFQIIESLKIDPFLSKEYIERRVNKIARNKKKYPNNKQRWEFPEERGLFGLLYLHLCASSEEFVNSIAVISKKIVNDLFPGEFANSIDYDNRATFEQNQIFLSALEEKLKKMKAFL